ncbi:hypothetical protein SGFS_084040 [Streptomyces graminofaciens]|uniref:Integral membrane protein n=1 Tax=Streptomyces graminofaciens TaxID=68212 RepID=A0ABN5VV29_9ACTN|nr:hypothetical protein [Streptomyces graminofaciens]BBC37110.1 hypothetical protein SGFS_084040 [Streptomyces graminofaciens]
MSETPGVPSGAEPVTLSAVPRQRDRPPTSWAGPDPIDELAERLREFIAAAVHPDEIAALLESDGMSDDRIRERYGCRNSFALAEELYGRVERNHPEPDGSPYDPWRTGLLGCLLRGVVFALPGLGYVLGAPLLMGPHDIRGLPAGTVPLFAGALCGWTWNQGLAHRAYSWLGLGDRDAARRSLLAGAPVGVLLGSLVAFLAAGTGDSGAVAFAVGEACYLGAATVLLVMGRERALLYCLLPMTAGALFALAREMPDGARLTLLAVSLAAVVVLAGLEVAPAARKPDLGVWSAGFPALLPFGAQPGTPVGTPAKAPSGPPLIASIPYALFGLGSGVLVLYAGLEDMLSGEAHSTVAAPAAVALTLSMGPAEWLLHRFRSGSLTGLRASSTPRAFRHGTAVTLVQCLAGYLAALLVLAHVTVTLWPHSPRLPAALGQADTAVPLDGLRLASLLLLGVVLWTGLLLQSFGAVLSAVAVCCAAAVAQTVVLATDSAGPHRAGLIVYGTASAIQAVLVCALLGKATAHR